MIKENVLIGHIMIDLAAYPIISTLSIEEKANYYDAIMKKYRKEEYKQHLINEKVKMCFDFSCIDIDKCKAWSEIKSEEHKANSSKGGVKSGETRRAKKAAREQAEQTDKETAPPSDDTPLVGVEEVEQYPFEEFYSVFPMHRDKTIAEKCWSKMPNEVRKVAFEGAKKYAAYIEYRKQYEKNVKVMYPSTYLHQKRWEDEYEITTETNNQSASSYGSNNCQQVGRTQQQINIERNAQAVAKMFSEIRPMQPDGGDN